MKKSVNKDNSAKPKPMNHFVSSGITGLNDVLHGGFRRNASILIAGRPGCGKTIFGLHFIMEGVKNGEPSLYITTEETTASVEEYAKSIGFDIETYKKKGLLYIVEQRPGKGRLMTIEAPVKLIREKSIKRVVLDSLTIFEYVYSSSTDEFRKGVLQFIMDMKDSGVTLMATSSRAFTKADEVQYKPEDSLFEGSIVLLKVRKGAVFERVLTVDKLRGQSHMLGLYPFKIDEKGLEVFPKEIPFSLVEEEKK